MFTPKDTLLLAFLAVWVPATSSLAHDDNGAVKDPRGVSITATAAQESDSEVTSSRAKVPPLRGHDHETALIDTCPQLAYEPETDGLRKCVEVLTGQISDLLKLIMNLSEALAESRNELLQRTDDGRHHSRILPMADNS